MKSYNPVRSTNFARCMLACSLFCCVAVAPALSQFSSLSPLPGTGKLKQPSKPTKFTFVVAGDNRPCTRTDKQSAIPEEIFKDAAKKGADFVLWTGDTIYGKDKCNGSGKDPCDASTMKEEYKKFFDIAKDAGVPVFNAPGNHEMDNNDDVPNADMTSLYAKYAAQPYGSFDYGDSHFIALNTEEVGNPATSKNPANGEDTPATNALDPGYVSQKQLDALDADLQANSTKAHVFIFMHHPMEAFKSDDQLDPASTAALKAIFAKYTNISYVLSGHEHMYFNPQGTNSTDPPPSQTTPTMSVPYYIVTGGAGAPLKGTKKGECGSTKSKDPGAFYHYLVFKVDGVNVTGEIHQVK